MKRLAILFILAISAVAIYSCGPHQYTTRSTGIENTSYFVVLSQERGNYSNISLEIDGVSTPVEKVFIPKFKRKAHPIPTTPGKHKVRVMQGGNVLFEENVLLGLGETRKIVLR